MTPERWKEIEEIFGEALDLPTEERGALLDRRCEGDAPLRAEVESLLACAPGAAGRIGQAIGREVSSLAPAVPPGKRRLGAYRLMHELGQGGMGAVYLAVRDDDAYRTEVAIKVLHGGLETAEAVARFRDERQILATLDHPGIVRLLDGGSTEEGLPYLVMERVEGSPITRWAAAQQASLNARIELFRKVCAAVAFAHQKLVVHRDIKPSNILVTAKGEPKLLDFGIAKLLDPVAGAAREARTGTGMRLLTLEYASPEQMRSEPTTTSTDVYSLGAVLYELLADAPAHRIQGEGMEAIRAVLEVDPPRPSAVAPAARRAVLRGDLDNIVAKALHKDANLRYASVEQLSGDLGRYLDGLPVLARPGTFTYRVGKLLRRRRGIVAAAGIILLTLSTATVVSLRQAHRADEQARRASLREADVRRLANSMLFEVDGKIQNLEGATEARALLVSRSLSYLDSLAAEAGGDVALSRELAAGYVKIAEIQGDNQGPNLGRPREALASYTKAKEILDRLVASGNGDAATRWTLVRMHFGMGRVYGTLHESGPARTSSLAALEVVATLKDERPFDYSLVARGLVGGFQAELDEGNIELAVRHAEGCLDVATRWTREDPSPEARYWIGVAHEARALSLLAAADPDAALSALREAFSLFSALSAEHPEDASYRREIWTARFGIATCLTGVGNGKIWFPSAVDPASAERELDVAVALVERQAQRDPSDARAAIDLGGALDQLAATLAGQDPPAALAVFLRARAVFAALPEAARASAYSRQFEPFGQCAMAEPLARQGRKAEALQASESGLQIAVSDANEPTAGLDTKMRMPMCRYQAARARHAAGEDAAAVELLQKAASDLRSLHASHPTALAPHIGLVETLDLLGTLQPEKRCDHLAQAVSTWSSWPGKPTPYTLRQRARLEAALAGCAGAAQKK